MPSPAYDHDDRAADWAARVDAGPLTEQEERALETWLREDPRHAEAFDRFRRLAARLAARVPQLAGAGVLPETTVTRVSRAAWLRWSSGLAAAAVLAVVAGWWIRRPQTLATTAAERLGVTLADGSRVDLNARTSLAVRLRGHERRVELAQGEAFFEIAKDASRPFVVATPAGSVRATGTAFNVRTDRDAVEVTVLEGSVAVVTAAGDSRALESRDHLRFDERNVFQRRLGAEAAEDAIAWRKGRVVFEHEPLARAVARFAHYHGVRIDVAEGVAGLELGGRFKLDELDAFLRDVAVALPVRVVRREGHIRIVAR